MVDGDRFGIERRGHGVEELYPPLRTGESRSSVGMACVAWRSRSSSPPCNAISVRLEITGKRAAAVRDLHRERLVGEHSGAGLVTAQRHVLCSPT